MIYNYGGLKKADGTLISNGAAAYYAFKVVNGVLKYQTYTCATNSVATFYEYATLTRQTLFSEVCANGPTKYTPALDGNAPACFNTIIIDDDNWISLYGSDGSYAKRCGYVFNLGE